MVCRQGPGGSESLWWLAVAFVTLWVALCPATSHAARRALVIANQAYPSDPLVTPNADAALIASKLRQAGFETVTAKHDLTKTELRSAVNTFASSVTPGDIAFLYYAGHGFEIEGRNYLIPTDFAAQNEFEAQDDGYPLDTLLRILESKGATVTIAVFDACRTAPSLTRGWGRTAGARGFVAVSNTPKAMYLAFSAAQGEEAADRVAGSVNSPFATALSRHILTAGMDLDVVFRNVRADVQKATAHRQHPMSMHNLTQNSFALVAGTAGGNEHAQPAPQPAPVATPAPAPAPEPEQPPTTVEKPRIDWVRIPGGSFKMGSDEGLHCLVSDCNPGGNNSKPPHTVNVRSFEISRTEVTVEQYRACVEAGVCRLPCRDGWNCNFTRVAPEDYPANYVPWKDAVAFANWVGGRLPSEAEWEYAARGGESYDYAGSDSSREVGHWSSPNSNALRVCQKKKNGFGLCDMSGNQEEWVQDVHHENYERAPTDGSAWLLPSAEDRVLRGGSWCDNMEHHLMVTAREHHSGNPYATTNPCLGFRVAR